MSRFRLFVLAMASFLAVLGNRFSRNPLLWVYVGFLHLILPVVGGMG